MLSVILLNSWKPRCQISKLTPPERTPIGSLLYTTRPVSVDSGGVRLSFSHEDRMNIDIASSGKKQFVFFILSGVHLLMFRKQQLPRFSFEAYRRLANGVTTNR